MHWSIRASKYFNVIAIAKLSRTGALNISISLLQHNVGNIHFPTSNFFKDWK